MLGSSNAIAIAGRATAEGTRRYRERHKKNCAAASEKLVRSLPARLELALTWANQMSILTLLWRPL
jgi:hypothetical protein